MGGISAGKGFDFQTRYAVCNVPLWLLEVAFQQLFFEGTGDIDIRYTEAGKSSRIHIQVKDHDVQPAELKTVIEQFSQLDSDHPDTYKCFTVVCPSLSPTIAHRPPRKELARDLAKEWRRGLSLALSSIRSSWN